MARYRKIDTAIWSDKDFRALPDWEKNAVIYRLVHNQPDPQFAQYVGPQYRVALEPKRRPDLYSSEWRKLRLEVIEEQGAICFYCKSDCSADPTVDHIRPVCAGGDHRERSNLVVSCRSCNSRKGGKEGWL